MKNAEFKDLMLRSEDPFSDIIGQDDVKKALKSALLSGRHIILVGAPGIGKTTLAKNVANLLKANGKNKAPFIRIQGSPDLTVEDLLGDIDPIKAMKFGPLSLEAFTKGKIFKADKGILFFDEMNRCSEKLHNSLLQVLEERKATIGSYDVDFDIDFILIGTINPEDSSTEKLSDVLLDRFDLIYMHYPETLETEKKIVRLKGKKLVEIDDRLVNLIVYFVRILREDINLEKKPSVRASIGLYERSQANALIDGRDSVNFCDIKDSVVSVLSHRMRLKPSIKYLQSVPDYIEKSFNKHFNDESWEKELEKSGFL